jgi:protein CWC15
MEERKRFQAKQELIDRNKEEELLKGNPLVAGEDYSLKKKFIRLFN